MSVKGEIQRQSLQKCMEPTFLNDNKHYNDSRNI